MMTANELLDNIFDRINELFQNLMSDNDIERLIGDIISEELTLENFQSITQEYLNAVDTLVQNGRNVNPFLKKILLILSELDSIDADIMISVEFKVFGINNSLLNNLYINDEPISNVFLDVNKLIVLEKLHINFMEFILNLKEQDDTSQKLLYLAKALVDNFDYAINPQDNRFIFVSNCSNDDIQNYRHNHNELIAYLKLCILAEGASFHKHFLLTNSTQKQNIQCDSSKRIVQFNEILYILSEYNYSNDLLNKYFLLYTIIENFMYRKPIAQMLRSSQEFSIRDFKRFYSKIVSNEAQKIDELFKDILDISINNSRISDDIKQKFEVFRNISNNDNGETKLIEFLKKIGISNKRGDLTLDMIIDNLKGNNNSTGYFGRIVYQLRNSILHNTATEFHITHYELSKNEVIVNFLRDLMIPVLEKIILYLIVNNHEIISYDKNELTLFNCS